MDAIIKKLKYGDFAKFTEYLRGDEKFYPKTAEELEKGRIVRAEAVGHLPRMPYGVRQVPDYIGPAGHVRRTIKRRRATAAEPGSSTSTRTTCRAGCSICSSCRCTRRCRGTISSWRFSRSWRTFRSFASTRALQAFVEELALFRKPWRSRIFPYSDLAAHDGSLVRPIRLHDTGIHYLGWTREQAIEYMRSNSAMPMHSRGGRSLHRLAGRMAVEMKMRTAHRCGIAAGRSVRCAGVSRRRARKRRLAARHVGDQRASVDRQARHR